MAYLPVVCDSCGTFFINRNIIGGSGTVTFTSVGVEPCPNCEGMGRVPDGTYQLANDSVRLLQGPNRTKDELKRFANILRGIVEDNTSVEEAVSTVRHEFPDLAPVMEEIRKTRNAEWQQFWIKVILTIIGLLAASQNVDIQDVNIDIDRAIDITVEQQSRQAPRRDASRTARKIGRNDPCPCGSGKKYKKCCGNPVGSR